MTSKKIDVYRRRKGRHVLFRGVPALVCHACGRKVFEADAVETMERGLEHPTKNAQKAELTIISA